MLKFLNNVCIYSYIEACICARMDEMDGVLDVKWSQKILHRTDFSLYV